MPPPPPKKPFTKPMSAPQIDKRKIFLAGKKFSSPLFSDKNFDIIIILSLFLKKIFDYLAQMYYNEMVILNLKGAI